MLLAWLLSLLGLLFVFEASVAQSMTMFGHQYHFVRHQSQWLAAGTILMLVVSFIPPQWYRQAAVVVYTAGVILLGLVLIPGIGVSINGARRWLALGNLSFQPVEIMKLGLVLFFAHWLSHHQRWQPFVFLAGLPIGLVLLQPDLGSTLIVVSIAVGMYFLAGGTLKSISILGAAGLVGLILLVTTSSYRWQRVQTFINLESDPLGTGFHVRQITLALGSGGWFGQGIGKSRQKFSYIPEVSNDSIFAIVAEELGFVGSLVVLAGFGWFVKSLFSCLKATQHQPYLYLLAAGVTLWLTAQIILNLAAVVVVVPLTGLPLPFFSYGGSALVMLLLATGVASAAARYSTRS